jgi:ABC-2 type transport system ATP-binding protein
MEKAGPSARDPADSTAPHALLLDLQGVGRDFAGQAALREITFSIGKGELVGFLGPNGAGKTTTFKLIMGNLRPTRGQVRVMGLNPVKESIRVRELVGHTPDEPGFFDALTGQETLDYVAAVRGIDVDTVEANLEEPIQLLDMTWDLDRRVGDYSLGMRKKLAFLVALLHRPRLLLLDEPMNGLDPPSAHKMRDYLARYVAEGNSVLMATHLVDLAERACTRILMLRDGELIVDGSAERLRQVAGLADDSTMDEAAVKLMLASQDGGFLG